MAQGKKTFIFYSDWVKLVNAMPSDKAGDLLKLMLAYVNDEQPEEPLDPFIIMAWAHIKPMLKKDLKQWEQKKKRFSKMGKESARKRKLTQVEPTSTVNVNDNVNVIYNKFVDEVKKGEHDSAVEQMYRNLKITKGSLTPLLEQFKGQLIIDNKVHKNTLDLRKHFNNWLNTQDRLDKLKPYKKQKTL